MGGRAGPEQVLLFINKHQENVQLWVAASWANTETAIEIRIRRSLKSLEIVLHGHGTFHTPWKKSADIFCRGEFGCCLLLGFFEGLLCYSVSVVVSRLSACLYLVWKYMTLHLVSCYSL